MFQQVVHPEGSGYLGVESLTSQASPSDEQPQECRIYVTGRRLIARIKEIGLCSAAEAAGINPRTASKWQARFEAEGLARRLDLSSRPNRLREEVGEATLQRIEGLRRPRTPMRRIAEVVGLNPATISRLLNRLELFSLKDLEPDKPVVRYVHMALARCCTWTPKSWGVSCGLA